MSRQRSRFSVISSPLRFISSDVERSLRPAMHREASDRTAVIPDPHHTNRFMIRPQRKSISETTMMMRIIIVATSWY